MTVKKHKSSNAYDKRSAKQRKRAEKSIAELEGNRSLTLAAAKELVGEIVYNQRLKLAVTQAEFDLAFADCKTCAVISHDSTIKPLYSKQKILKVIAACFVRSKPSKASSVGGRRHAR
jgi:hypothetical protein